MAEAEEFVEIKEQKDVEETDALTLDDLNVSFIKNPEVGGSPIEFTISKIRKLEGKALVGKTREGKEFKTNLSGVDFGYEVVTNDGSKYTISAWEVFGKLKAIFNKLKTISGIRIRITHVLNGLLTDNKGKDCYKVEAYVDGAYKVLDKESNEWKQ